MKKSGKEDRVHIATLEETVNFSTGGAVAVLLLIIFQLVMVVLFGATKSAVQEASAGTLWIAGNILLGVFVLRGSRRTYRVFREFEKNS